MEPTLTEKEQSNDDFNNTKCHLFNQNAFDFLENLFDRLMALSEESRQRIISAYRMAKCIEILGSQRLCSRRHDLFGFVWARHVADKIITGDY